MEALVILSFILGCVIWGIVSANKITSEMPPKVLRAENERTGLEFKLEDVLFFGTAKFSGEISKSQLPFDALIYTINNQVYVCSQKNIRFSVAVADISDFGVSEIDMPYIMNVNVAALFANELTRRQYSNNFYIIYSKDNLNFDGFRLENFKLCNEFSNHLSKHPSLNI